MATQKNAIEELNFLSSVLSERARFLNVGVLAIGWALLVEHPEAASANTMDERYVLISLLFAILSLVLDFLQYLAGYVMVRRIVISKQKKFKYEERKFFMIVREWCFNLKILSVSVASLFSILGLIERFSDTLI